MSIKQCSSCGGFCQNGCERKDVQPKRDIYRCSKCNGLYERDSTKVWIKSYCLKTDQSARLMRVKEITAEQLSNPNKLTWRSLTDAEIIAICDQREDLIDCVRAVERALMEKNNC